MREELEEEPTLGDESVLRCIPEDQPGEGSMLAGDGGSHVSRSPCDLAVSKSSEND